MRISDGSSDVCSSDLAEANDSAVLQEPSDDALHPDVLGQSRHAGPEAADATDDQVDGNAGLRGLVEGIDDLRIDQGVQLGPDRRSEERREGKEGVSTGRSRWWPYN